STETNHIDDRIDGVGGLQSLERLVHLAALTSAKDAARQATSERHMGADSCEVLVAPTRRVALVHVKELQDIRVLVLVVPRAIECVERHLGLPIEQEGRAVGKPCTVQIAWRLPSTTSGSCCV